MVSAQTMATISQSVKLTDVRQDVRIGLTALARESLTASRAANFANERLVLQLQDIQDDRPVGVSYLLFLNLPAAAKNPDHTHPNFIGTLGFFGKTEGPGHAGASEGGLAEEYDVTAVLQRLGTTDDLRLSVIPSYPSVPADRKDLQAMVAKLKPQGSPRFGRMVLPDAVLCDVWVRPQDRVHRPAGRRLTRVILGKHRVLDVAAGLAVGTICSFTPPHVMRMPR